MCTHAPHREPYDAYIDLTENARRTSIPLFNRKSRRREREGGGRAGAPADSTLHLDVATPRVNLASTPLATRANRALDLPEAAHLPASSVSRRVSARRMEGGAGRPMRC